MSALRVPPLRPLTVLLALGMLLASALRVSAADNVVHSNVPVDQTITFPAGPEAPCFLVPAGTPITIHNTGNLRMTAFADGPNAGDVHVHGQLASAFFVPSNGAAGEAPVIINFRSGRHTTRNTNVVHMTGALPDGTELKAQFHFHIILHDGVLRLDLASVNCIRP